VDAERIVEFFCLIPQIRPPKRAERSAAGYLPSRAMRYCDALTSATGYGYWVFPPMDIRLIWDGEQVFWSYGADETWLPLSGTGSGAVQFPNYSAVFDESVPEFLRGYSPPFLTALPEAGGVQIWTGLLAKTRPGWSLSVRAPVNLPAIPGLVAWEGIIETDLWLGPLFTNMRLTRTDFPVHIRAHAPFLQVQPVPQLAYREETLADFECRQVSDLTELDWNRLGQVLLPHPDAEVRQGNYAVAVRKRRLCPVAHGLSVKS
jgi:Family of unknown function (DUF6065)